MQPSIFKGVTMIDQYKNEFITLYTNNVNSWHLLEKLGFTREAHLCQNVYFNTDANGNPIWKDTFVYAILNK